MKCKLKHTDKEVNIVCLKDIGLNHGAKVLMDEFGAIYQPYELEMLHDKVIVNDEIYDILKLLPSGYILLSDGNIYDMKDLNFIPRKKITVSEIIDARKPEAEPEVSGKKVCIRGVPERGKEVIELLTSLGGKNKGGYDGYDDNLLYYIDEGNGCIIENIQIDSTLGKLLKCNFDELKLPELPKPPVKHVFEIEEGDTTCTGCKFEKICDNYCVQNYIHCDKFNLNTLKEITNESANN